MKLNFNSFAKGLICINVYRKWIPLSSGVVVSNLVGDIPCNIITGGGRTAEGLANSWMFGNYQDDFW